VLQGTGTLIMNKQTGTHLIIRIALACGLPLLFLGAAPATLTARGDVYINWTSTTDPDVFDAQMRAVPANTTVHIGPGVFLTRGLYIGGDRPPGSLGFAVPTGCKIFGADTNTTTGTVLLLKDFVADHDNTVIGNNAGANIRTDWAIEVHDLQIDCNGVVLSQGISNLRLQGIELWGTDCCTVQNVLVRRATGRTGTTETETFVVSINSAAGLSTGNLIDHCSVTDYVTGMCSAISLNKRSRNPDVVTNFNGFIQGSVTWCTVTMPDPVGKFAYNATDSFNCTFAHNISRGAGRCFNNDTFWDEGLYFDSNDFEVPPGNCAGLYLMNGARYSQAVNNVITLTGTDNSAVFITGANDDATYMGLGCSDWRFLSNQIKTNGGNWDVSLSRGFNVQAGGYWTVPDRIDLENNTIWYPLNNNVPASVGYMSGNLNNYGQPAAGFPAQPNAGWTYSSGPALPAIINKYDFNGDALPDLLFQNAGYTLKTWLFGFYNGIDYDDPGDWKYHWGHPTEAPIVPAQPTGAWSVSAMADINRDGQVDLIWKYEPTGQMAYWIMNGNQFVTAGDIRDAYMNLVPCTSGWKPVGAATLMVTECLTFSFSTQMGLWQCGTWTGIQGVTRTGFRTS
jgi:hypothetical protein